MRRIIIGADGGGTKTRLAAFDADTFEFVSSSVCGSIHWLSLGVRTAADELGKGIASLGIGRGDEIVAVSAGDPSLDDSDPSRGREFLELAGKEYAPGARLFSKSDVFMALYAFSRGKPAALLVGGTGSMGAALTEQYDFSRPSRLFTVGGWGDPVRDPGSGYHAALSAIGAALDAFDGIGEKTTICGAVLDYFGVKNPRELIDVFNPGSVSRAFVADFARMVEECADAGDAVAARILSAEGETLGRYALSLLGVLPEGEKRLGLYGGFLTKCRAVRETAERTVREKYPRAEIAEPDVPAQTGAALYAADALESEKRR